MPEGEIETEITKGARVVVDGLKARPELNGSFGTIVGDVNEETGRWNVMVDDMREPLALKLANLMLDEKFAGLVVDTRVRIYGLEKKEELNGKLGVVQSFMGERCQVYCEHIRECVALKREHMVIAEEAKSAKAGSGLGAVDVGDGEEATTPIRMECNGVVLKLSLTAKQMGKPFADALLKPFLKAYSKKKGLDKVVETKDVAQIVVDSEGQTKMEEIKDLHFPAEECLKMCGEDIEIEVRLKDPTKAPKAPEKKSSSETRLPKDARVLIHGLTSQAGQGLNGLEGRVTGLNEAKQRYDVTLTDGRVVSAKMENLIDLKHHTL